MICTYLSTGNHFIITSSSWTSHHPDLHSTTSSTLCGCCIVSYSLEQTCRYHRYHILLILSRSGVSKLDRPRLPSDVSYSANIFFHSSNHYEEMERVSSSWLGLTGFLTFIRHYSICQQYRDQSNGNYLFWTFCLIYYLFTTYFTKKYYFFTTFK